MNGGVAEKFRDCDNFQKVVEQRPEQVGMFDGLLEQEEPLHYSNVALVDPEDGKACRVKFVYNQAGKRVRVSTRSNRILPFPVKEKDDYMELIAPGKVR